MKRTCFRWHSSFLKGEESCELEEGEGALVITFTTETINTGAAIIRTDSRLTVRQLTSILHISIESTHTLLKQHLNMSRVYARWIPHYLTSDRMVKVNRVEVFQLWTKCVEEKGDAW